MFRNILCVVALMMLAGCATTYSVAPNAVEGQTTRYMQGTATTLEERPHGAIEIVPAGIVDGDIGFRIVAFNGSPDPVNFGIENITMSAGEPLDVYTADYLTRRARNRATWAAIAAAVSGVAVAAALDNDSSTSRTRGYVGRTPINVTHTYDPGGISDGTIVAGVATAGAIYAIRQNMRNTLSMISNQVLQTTTVEPKGMVGALIIGDTPDDYPADVRLVISWLGEEYTFDYRVEREQ